MEVCQKGLEKTQGRLLKTLFLEIKQAKSLRNELSFPTGKCYSNDE
jgi:hypothetical protein